MLPCLNADSGSCWRNNIDAFAKKFVKGTEPGRDTASDPRKIVKSIARAQQIK
jgi:hypothetical protein